MIGAETIPRELRGLFAKLVKRVDEEQCQAHYVALNALRGCGTKSGWRSC